MNDYRNQPVPAEVYRSMPCGLVQMLSLGEDLVRTGRSHYLLFHKRMPVGLGAIPSTDRSTWVLNLSDCRA